MATVNWPSFPKWCFIYALSLAVVRRQLPGVCWLAAPRMPLALPTYGVLSCFARRSQKLSCDAPRRRF